MTDLWTLQLGALDLRPGQRVLELGCGAGFTTERLLAAGVSVTAIEIDPTVAAAARERLGARASVIEADAYHGWPGGAPYDSVLVGFAVQRLPPAWLGQLGPDGVLVAPMGPPDRVQELTRFERAPGVGIQRKRIAAVRCDAMRRPKDR